MNLRRSREYYLSDIPLEEALGLLDESLSGRTRFISMDSERVGIADSVGRVVCEDVYANHSSPLVNTAAMDGIALNSSSTVGASETSPLDVQVERDFNWVDTGDAMPLGFDAVIMAEDVTQLDEEHATIRSPAPPYQHVRRIAEDIASPELLLKKGSRIRILDIPCLAASGNGDVKVSAKPKVAILPTGNELVPIGTEPMPGQVIEFNSVVVSKQVMEWGGDPCVVEPLPDEKDKIASRILELTNSHDVVVILAGSSAGAEDFTGEVLDEVGEILLHGVAIRPGHPIIIGFVNHVPVFGLPGYPSSTEITSDIFLKRTLEYMIGGGNIRREKVNAVLSRKTVSPMGEDEFVRVTLGYVSNRYIATPASRGAAMTLSMSRSDGVALIPSSTEGLEEGSEVSVELVRAKSEIDRTITMSGSDDIALHVLGGVLSERHPGLRLATSSVGSVGGLIALSKGYAHLAGSHLLDPETGIYNQSAVKRFFPEGGVFLVNFVGRTQGLMFPPKNPKGIRSLSSISENECVFINRQRGSGTRLFLDYKLEEIGLGWQQVRGYQNEEYTHWAVAASIASGHADVGLGIKAAADSAGLDFIPLGEEKYQLVVRGIFESLGPDIAKLIEVLGSLELRKRIEAIGGYDVTDIGNVIRL